VIWRTEHIGTARVSVIQADVTSASPEVLADALGAERVVMVSQVHGADAMWVEQVTDGSEADAILTGRPGVAPVVRVADCVPIGLVDRSGAWGGVVHAGRAGLVAGVVPAAVDALRGAGADRLVAVVGPRICGHCYELSDELAESVAAAVPAARSTTSWGTPAADIGAGVVAQLRERQVEVLDLGADQCTRENDHWFSYRRQGGAAGRFGIAVVLS